MLVSIELEVQRLIALFKPLQNVILKVAILAWHFFIRCSLLQVLSSVLLSVARSVHRNALCLEHWKILLLNPLRVVVIELALAFWILFHEVFAIITLFTHKYDLRCVDDVLVYHLLIVFPLARLHRFGKLRANLLIDFRKFLEISLLNFISEFSLVFHRL